MLYNMLCNCNHIPLLYPKKKRKKIKIKSKKIDKQTRELYMITIVFKYRKYFLIIILLHILWVVR